jgi:nucleoside 2-deoxyribosyltransferase
MTMKIYLAGPLGFSEAGAAFHNERMIPLLKGLGHEVLDPWRLIDESKIGAVLELPYGIERREAWQKLNPEIGRINQLAIDACDTVFAVLDGVDVDSGTASEIGYAFAKGKRIIGYRGDYRLSADNDGSIVNLQVEYFITHSGGSIITKLADAERALDALLRSE